MFTGTKIKLKEAFRLLICSAFTASILFAGCSEQNPVWPGSESQAVKNVIPETVPLGIESTSEGKLPTEAGSVEGAESTGSAGNYTITVNKTGRLNLRPMQVLNLPLTETNVNAMSMNNTGSVTEGGEMLQVMVRDIGGTLLTQPLRPVNVPLNVKCYIDIYWSQAEGRMKNILAPMIPSRPKDLFGHSNRVQSKWWPLVSEFKMMSMPDDFIAWVFVELRDEVSGTAYCRPGYLDSDGYLRDVSGAMFSMSVAQDISYNLILHTFNGITVVAADGGTSLKNFRVTKGTVIEWNFTEEWTRALIHSSYLSYPMVELQGPDYTTVWAVASGDVPSDFSLGGQVTWDDMIDLSDLNSIEQNFGPNPGFSIYEMNQDKKIDRSDIEYVGGNTILCISGNPYTYISAVK
jgi:hypothetical protein